MVITEKKKESLRLAKHSIELKDFIVLWRPMEDKSASDTQLMRMDTKPKS